MQLLVSDACSPDRPESAALRCSLMLDFLGLLRRGDPLAGAAAAFDPAVNLCVGDVQVQAGGGRGLQGQQG